MAKAYIFRHQIGGYDTSHVFTQPPTDEQMEALAKRADTTFGEGWAIYSEVELVTDGTVPEFDAIDPMLFGGLESGNIRMSLFSCSGVGHVEELP
jgi:hypothetical protein